MSAHSFGIRTASDLLDKAERELHRYRKAVSDTPQDLQKQSDHAFNFVITAWHVTDWVWRETENGKGSWHGCKSFKEFVSKVRSECQALKICHELATGSKHFHIREKQAQTVAKTDTKTTIGGGVLRPALRPVLRPALSSAFGGYTVPGLVIKLKSNATRKPTDVFEQALDYWKEKLCGKET